MPIQCHRFQDGGCDGSHVGIRSRSLSEERLGRLLLDVKCRRPSSLLDFEVATIFKMADAVVMLDVAAADKNASSD
jgi:hypothetical protein